MRSGRRSQKRKMECDTTLLSATQLARRGIACRGWRARRGGGSRVKRADKDNNGLSGIKDEFIPRRRFCGDPTGVMRGDGNSVIVKTLYMGKSRGRSAMCVAWLIVLRRRLRDRSCSRSEAPKGIQRVHNVEALEKWEYVTRGRVDYCLVSSRPD